MVVASVVVASVVVDPVVVDPVVAASVVVDPVITGEQYRCTVYVNNRSAEMCYNTISCHIVI